MGSGTKKAALYSSLNFLLWLGFGCGYFAINALFLERVGAVSLFQIYFCESIAALTLSLLVYHMVDRFPRKSFFAASFVTLGAAMTLACLLLKGWPHSHLIAFSARIFAFCAFVLSETLFWLSAGSAFSGYESGRWFPVISAVGVCGGVIGGLTNNALTHLIHTENLPLVWAAAFLLAPFLLRQIHDASGNERGASTSLLWGEIVSQGEVQRSRSLLASPLVLLLLVFWIVYTLFSHGTDFVFNAVASASIPQTDRLTEFFGKVTAAATAGVLVYQLMIHPWLRRREGVALGMIVVVALMAGPLLWAAWRPTLIPLAVAQGAIYFVVETLAGSQLATLLSAFPERLRGRIRVFTDGFGRPLGNLCLLGIAGLQRFHPDPLLLCRWLAIGALVFCAYPFFFRRAYRNHLHQCLKSSDRSVVINAIQALGKPEKSESSEILLKLLKGSREIDIQGSVAISLGTIQNREAFSEIVRLIRAPKEELQLAAVEALGHYQSEEGLLPLYDLLKSGEGVSLQVKINAVKLLSKLLRGEIIPFLAGHLRSEEARDSRILSNLIEALGLTGGRGIISHLLPFLLHENHRVRANAAIALYPFVPQTSGSRQRAQETISALFHSDENIQRRAGLYAIGALRLENYRKPLQKMISDLSLDKKTLQLTATALACLKDESFLPSFVTLLLDPEGPLAAETASRISLFPRFSRVALFARVDQLPEESKALIAYRLNECGLDFTTEREILNPTLLPLGGSLSMFHATLR